MCISFLSKYQSYDIEGKRTMNLKLLPADRLDGTRQCDSTVPLRRYIRKELNNRLWAGIAENVRRYLQQ